MSAPSSRKRTRRLRQPVLLLLLGALGALSLTQFWTPLSRLRHQQRELAELRVQRATLLAETQHLKRYKQYLATDAGQELAARRLGYLRPGERAVLFFHEEGERAPAVPSAHPTQP